MYAHVCPHLLHMVRHAVVVVYVDSVASPDVASKTAPANEVTSCERILSLGWEVPGVWAIFGGPLSDFTVGATYTKHTPPARV